MDIADRVRSAFRWMVALRFSTQLFTWGVTILVLRLLAPQDYGLVATAQIFLGLALAFGSGFESYLIQARNADADELRSVLGMALACAVVLATALLALAPTLAALFRMEGITLIVQILSAQILIAAFTVAPSSSLSRQMKFKEKSIVSAVSTLCASALTLILAMNGFGVWALVWPSLASAVIVLIGLQLASAQWVLPSFHWSRARNAVGFSVRYLSQHLLWWYYVEIDKVLLARTAGATTLGYYTTALHIASLPQQKLGQIISELSFAGLARANATGQLRNEYTSKAVSILATASAPVFLGLASIAAEFVPLVLGSQWTPAIVPIQLICLAMPFRMLLPVAAQANAAAGRIDITLGTVLRSAVVMTIAFLLLLSHGAVGLATAWAVASPFLCAWAFHRAREQTGITIRILLGHLAWPIGTAAFMATTVYFLRPHIPLPMPSIAGLGVSVVYGVLVYTAVMLVFQRQGLLNTIRFLR